jgi:hypothetical protein
MCDVREEYVDIMRNDPKVRGKSLSQLFPQHFMDNLPYHKIKVGCCILDGRPMSRHEMEPDNKTPRAICPDCYAKWTSQVTEICPICGESLPNNRVQVQREEPYEVALRIHDGKCLEYFATCSCKALDDDMTFLAEETGYQPQEQLTDRQSEFPSQIDKIVPSDHIPVQPKRVKVKR